MCGWTPTRTADWPGYGCWGPLTSQGRLALGLRWLNTLPAAQLARLAPWEGLRTGRPFASLEAALAAVPPGRGAGRARRSWPADVIDTVFVADRVVLPGGVVPAGIGVLDGRVVVGHRARQRPRRPAVPCGWPHDEVLLPGLVDSHVHLQNPGHPEWEDLAAATRAALLGGVTTLVDMPVDSEPVTIDVPAVAAKRSAMSGRVFTDVGLWAGVVPGNLGTLDALVNEGVLGFKAFMVSPGLDAFPPVSVDELTAALLELVPYDVPLLVHAEDASGSEVSAVRDVVAAALATGGRTHLVHVSDAASVRPGRVRPARQARGSRRRPARTTSYRRRELPVDQPAGTGNRCGAGTLVWAQPRVTSTSSCPTTHPANHPARQGRPVSPPCTCACR